MATVTFRSAIWNTTAGDKVPTAFTPAVGDLIVVLCGNSGRTTAQPPTVACDVQGIGFSQHATAYTKATSADSGWIFIANSFCTAASSTTVTMSQAGDTGGGCAVYTIAGLLRAGLGAIRQVGKQDNAGAGTPSITMGVAILTGNPVLGWVHNGTNGTTTTAPPTSWTENFDNGYNTPANGMETAHRSSGETNTTVAWTGASASAFGSILVELDASDPGGPTIPDVIARRVRQLSPQ